MRRFVAVWLPTWPTDRAARRIARRGTPARPDPTPLALVGAATGGLRLTAVDAVAAGLGLAPGMTLATARALHPELRTRPADPVGDARALAALVAWCRRFSPIAAADGDDGLALDATGCGRLFGGEDRLVDRLLGNLRRLRVAARAGIADNPAAAWALARFGGTGDRASAAPGASVAALTPLPVAALRLPAASVAMLARLGLERVGDLLAVPRAPLVARFGAEIARRLDEATGAVTPALAALPEAPRWIVRHGFTEPADEARVVLAVLARLVAGLIGELAEAGFGARRLIVDLLGADGRIARVTVGGHGPSGDIRHFGRLFALRLEAVTLGRGIDGLTLMAPDPAPLVSDQADFAGGERRRAPLGPVLDRLAARLGERAVVRLAGVASHVPERAQRAVPATSAVADAAHDPGAVPRPPRLLARPEPVDAVAAVPDAPPVLFRWRGRLHRVARADGPERIAPEWWQGGEAGTRDYYRVEDRDGARYWLYRLGPYDDRRRADWFLHGLFA